MRDVRFRAWIPKLKKMLPVAEYRWHYQTLSAAGETRQLLADLSATAVDDAGQEFPVRYDVSRNAFPVMQWTGMENCKGVEIYEGDILAFKRDVGVVTYENTEFVAISRANVDFCNLLMPESEVIGNIYENPELLEAKS